MNYKLFYYITHYLWLFQLIFNLLLIAKALLFKRKYKKNSLFLGGYLLFLFPIVIEFLFGLIFVMYDYVYNTRINGPFYWFPEIMITLALAISNMFLWFYSNWRFTYEKDKFIYHNLFFKLKTISFDEIDCLESYIVKPKNQKYLHYNHYQYLILVLSNKERIKIMFDSCFFRGDSAFLVLDIEKFLTKKLKLKVKLLTYEEYKKEKS